MFHPLLLIALLIFLLGLGYKLFTWFSRSIGSRPEAIGIGGRLKAAAAGSLRAVSGPKIKELLKALMLDVLLQLRVFRESRWRWVAHMLLFYGFTLLLLMHALQSVVSENLFSDYYSTADPFYFLRDFFGAMVLVGAGLMIARRYVAPPRRLRSNSRDHVAIGLLAAIVLSGFLLEGLKITSHYEFIVMVEDYAGLDDEDEIAALRALWIKEYGLVAAHGPGELQEADLELGREVHELNCAVCHAPAGHAFVSFAVARLIEPAALWLERAGAVNILWHIHFIICFAALAYLPFSKMFHLIATPVSLVVNRVMDPHSAAPANLVTRQIMELDACTHCGSCSLSCSAAMMHAALGNENILPSEKIIALRRLAAGAELNDSQRRSLQEGVYICTNCDRCTVRCPSGIRLKDIWFAVREQLLHTAAPTAAVLSPFSFARGLVVRDRLSEDDYAQPLERAFEQVGAVKSASADTAEPVVLDAGPQRRPALKTYSDSFRHCFSCQTCTSVCPVVGNFDVPENAVGLLPHQIMCCLALGLNDMAAGAGMIWDCLTCYQCQESCPQQVNVCDLLFELKNRAAEADGNQR